MKSLLVVSIVFVLIIIQGTTIGGTRFPTSDENSNEEYTYVEYEEEESSEESTLPPIPTTTSRVILSTELETEGPTIANEFECPTNCKCNKKITLVDCSHQNLMQIPKNLPQSTVYLNLSHNSLKTLNVNDLINCGELRQLYLNNNEIGKIVNTEDFAKLPNLHHIDLSTNAFKPLQGKEFSKARGLLTLILTDNKDIVTSNVPIIQTEKLKTLYLANCSINQLPENIFQNLSSLVALNLDNNPLNLTQGVSAFKPLTELRRLFIPTVPRHIALNLCKNLQVIDIINLSLENHDISCFLLFNNATYEESTIRTDLFKTPTDPPSNSSIVVSTTAPTLSTHIQKGTEVLKQYANAAANQAKTTYEKMSMMYMILSGLVVVLLVAILSVFCIIGSRQLGREISYRKQNYRKYSAGNVTVENPNYERYLIECEKRQFTNE
ncbi:leucine-rich repeat and immunoglobulin-like domain-containing nogo receptor-interacting protein 2 [Contarinia nasturtii]|uniref:leucine-rich repeat and immunoglobulin-like domain-containing nogo receptor-interacting protein 2 n=1 Tax=Contarinia nasturtii TaxID=265458 RepID=UPI0012D42283|nr:leucine-rich repeat and immunoglobulin-like domain-containing nogo receptor-interacting protein 2 [Contarinia nasturtii]